MGLPAHIPCIGQINLPLEWKLWNQHCFEIVSVGSDVVNIVVGGSNMEATDETATTELTLEELQETFDFIRSCSDRVYKRTPLLTHWKDSGDCTELSRQCDLYLKLENMQITGTCNRVSLFQFVFSRSYWHHTVVCLSVCPFLFLFLLLLLRHLARINQIPLRAVHLQQEPQDVLRIVNCRLIIISHLIIN